MAALSFYLRCHFFIRLSIQVIGCRNDICTFIATCLGNLQIGPIKFSQYFLMHPLHY